MPEKTEAGFQGSSEGGVAAGHPTPQSLDVLVGPATSGEYNTLKPAMIPIACWRVEDLRFEFDSSFVRPEVKKEIAHLARLIGEKTQGGRKPPASVFGHADPTGNDDYNKTLSGRRAAAIYGLLTRDTALWDDLYSHPLGGDKWDADELRTMLDTTSAQAASDPGAFGGQGQAQASSYQYNPAKRRQLFLAYMDAICTNEKGVPFKLEKTDFLAQGADPGGKGDYQGCGEFNPSLVFSHEEQKELSKSQNKAKRDAENAPNRRVVLLLFRPGSRIDPQNWRCPRAKEGVAGCKKRCWSDGEVRRNPQAERREYRKTRDTFACRFYDRNAKTSPCEVVIRNVRIRLFDPFATPIPGAPYCVKSGSTERKGKADAYGWLVEDGFSALESVTVDWGYPPLEGTPPERPPHLIFHLSVFIDLMEEDEKEAARRRLHNLGYRCGHTLSDNIRAFQRSYGRPQTGELKDIKEDLWQYHDSHNPPPLPTSGPGDESEPSWEA